MVVMWESAHLTRNVLRYVQILARWVFVVDVTKGVEAIAIVMGDPRGKGKVVAPNILLRTDYSRRRCPTALWRIR